MGGQSTGGARVRAERGRRRMSAQGVLDTLKRIPVCCRRGIERSLRVRSGVWRRACQRPEYAVVEGLATPGLTCPPPSVRPGLTPERFQCLQCPGFVPARHANQGVGGRGSGAPPVPGLHPQHSFRRIAQSPDRSLTWRLSPRLGEITTGRTQVRLFRQSSLASPSW